MSHVSWVEMSPSLFAEGSCPKHSACGVSSAVGKVRAAQPPPGTWCAWLRSDAGFNGTSLPRMASLPSHGAVARPHPDEAGTIGGGCFPSNEGWWLMCRDGSSDATKPVSMRWSRTGAQAPPALQISLDLGQGTRTRLGAGAGAGWQRLGMGRASRFGVEELPAERVGCGPITASPCAVSTCRWHQDEARAEVLQDAPRHLGWGCGAGVHAVTAPNDMC